MILLELVANAGYILMPLFILGFITVAHYSKTDSYTQVTGYIDASKYSLAPTDGGGQYDTHGSGKPIGASCKGYPYFVSLIEPDVNRFCIRCCQNVVCTQSISVLNKKLQACSLRFIPSFRMTAHTVDPVMDVCVSFPATTLEHRATPLLVTVLPALPRRAAPPPTITTPPAQNTATPVSTMCFQKWIKLV